MHLVRRLSIAFIVVIDILTLRAITMCNVQSRRRYHKLYFGRRREYLDDQAWHLLWFMREWRTLAFAGRPRVSSELMTLMIASSAAEHVFHRRRTGGTPRAHRSRSRAVRPRRHRRTAGHVVSQLTVSCGKPRFPAVLHASPPLCDPVL